ncbi:hypothetical protein BpHYR1_014947 [Brachionus plicatilis]|uniref:Uncharacterized protein n=1 Tax=Brachionus plicatilis TaxID=10195 RepID=A0A3M7PU23_BRAPC|nr:hypothetical protein BpHYR1_014947 [Brachionus plicatilis]
MIKYIDMLMFQSIKIWKQEAFYLISNLSTQKPSQRTMLKSYTQNNDRIYNSEPPDHNRSGN